MEEKFSVSLELMIQKFKDNAKKVQTVSQNVANKIKENMSVKPTFDIDTTNVKLVESRMQELNKTIEYSKEIIQYGLNYPAWASWNTDAIQKAEKDLRSANAEIEYINGSLSIMNTNLDENSKSSIFFGNSLKKIQDGMNKSLKSAKRFTLSLFGIQSVYRMLSRASSAYLAQDSETSSKIQSAWIGLGSVFAPLLQMIADFAIKAVSYINVFIKALTGTDFLANAMAKSMNKANKSAGKLSKTLAGFDELTNLDNSSSGADLDTSWIDAFKDVKLDPKLVEFFENLGNVLKPVIETIKEFWNRLTDQQKLDVALLAISAVAIAISPLLGTIITIGIVVTGVALVLNNLKEVKGAYDNLAEAQKNANRKTQEWSDKMLEAIDSGKLTEDQIQMMINKTFDWIDANDKEIEAYDKKLSFIGKLLGLNDKQKEQMKLLIDENDIYLKTLKDLHDRGLLNEDQTKKYTQALKDQITRYEAISKGLDTTSKEYQNNKTKVQELAGELKNLTGKEYKTKFVLEGDTSNANKKMNTFVGKLKQFGSILLNTLFGGIKLPSFDVGTNYVPNNMLAQIHEGEAIIPKKFNSSEYFSNVNKNDDVVKKLDELIDRVENIEFNPYTTISDVGQASQKYRNQQSRIMGEELA